MCLPIQKIAIVGPESTGKSSLAAALAEKLSAPWVPEYARAYIDQLDRPYEQSDLRQIAQGQLAWEKQYASPSSQWLVCDTHLLVIQIWSEFKYGTVDACILDALNLQDYAYHLLTDIDLPWEADPQREHPHRRQELFDLYHQHLSLAGVPFGVVRGQDAQRIENAWGLIKGQAWFSEEK